MNRQFERNKNQIIRSYENAETMNDEEINKHIIIDLTKISGVSSCFSVKKGEYGISFYCGNTTVSHVYYKKHKHVRKEMFDIVETMRNF